MNLEDLAVIIGIGLLVWLAVITDWRLLVVLFAVLLLVFGSRR